MTEGNSPSENQLSVAEIMASIRAAEEILVPKIDTWAAVRLCIEIDRLTRDLENVIAYGDNQGKRGNRLHRALEGLVALILEGQPNGDGTYETALETLAFEGQRALRGRS